MTQFELNQIRAKLDRLELDERFIERYLAPSSTGTQGRKVLGFCMPHAITQIHCCHWDLGGFKCVCGVSLGDLRATAS